MAFADEISHLPKRGPGRPRVTPENGGEMPLPQGGTAPARSTPKYDPNQYYRVTIQNVEGGHQGPVPLTVVTEKETRRVVLLPDQPIRVSGRLLNESLEHAVVDERGPDLDQNLEALSRGEETISTVYDAEGRVQTRSKRLKGTIKKRFSYEVEKE